jgi:hypothetical protein
MKVVVFHGTLNKLAFKAVKKLVDNSNFEFKNFTFQRFNL